MFSTKTVYFTLVCLIGCYGRSYRNFAMLMGIPISDKELSFFKNLTQNYDVSFWKDPSYVYKPLQFIVNPREFNKLCKDAITHGISLSVVMMDIQSAFDHQLVGKYTRRKMSTFDWKSYYDLTAIYSWLEDIKSEYPKEVDVQSIGKTYEKRDIQAVKLLLGKDNKGIPSLHDSAKPYLTLLESKIISVKWEKHLGLYSTRSRPKVIIEGGIHGKEWISSAFVTYMIKELLGAPSSNNSELQEIATHYEFHFIPVANPDGYEFSHVHDRLWGKNRRGGYGVDLNRNFGLAFGELDDGRLNKYAHGYCGESPFSEAESASLAKFTKRNNENLKYYIAFHSFGQQFIIPYSFTKQHLGNYDEVKMMASSALRRLAERYGTEYSIGNAHETVGRLMSGASADWAKKTCNIPYVASMELRDTGKYGFALPSKQILPTCQETMDFMYSFLKPYQNITVYRKPKPRVIKKFMSKSSHLKSSLCHYLCLIVIIKV